ncbi:aspartic peptidase domain-containing protein [Apiospora hydei]|uniref:Aspartic peptidase domain-containing protein n=1 Tax=Apiospora hydei TaxID=1337664 RepID=A0ABR1VYM3_9PEZI
MKSIIFAALAASVLSQNIVVTTTAPLTLDDILQITTLGGMTFRVRQEPNQKYTGMRKGPLAMARAYSKYGVEFTDDLLAAIERLLEELGLGNNGSGNGAGNDDSSNSTSGQGEVAALPELFDSEYLCPVQIGTPPQTLNLDFDTGSSDLWVFSSETPKSQINGQAIYDISKSSTAQLVQGASWSISYGDGSSSSGNVYTDTVTVGGVTVKDQAVESARKVSAQFTQRASTDGLLGLAFSSINTVRPSQQKTFFDSALNGLAMPVFTANLKKGEAGNYNFGFIDRSEFTGDIAFFPVNASTGFWQFDASGFAIADGAPVSSPHAAIADTGTTLLLVPANIASAYYAKVPGATNDATAGGYTFPCSTSSSLPSFTAVIGDYRAVIPGDFIKYAPVDGNSFETATTCFGGIQEVPAGFPYAIYGDIFLKAQFVVFHGANQQVGFAAKPL